ncbi:MAG: aminotransferase class V-fold PLP-dependent enzyme, partial [Methanobrevibacter sp.]|nr:aminotransferase class V-fold PLP-dependent enzyme [Candidatus Methanoflexus mossambicus]
GNPNNIFGIVSFNIKGANPYDVSKILDENYNIAVRSGVHCAIPALNSINATEGTIRTSFHYYNTLDDVEKLVSAIKEIADFYS